MGVDTQAELLFSDPVATVIGWRDIAIVTWFRPGTVEQIRRTNEAQTTMFRKGGTRKFATMTVVHAEAVGNVDTAQRAAISEGTRASEPYLKLGVVVVPSSGFVSAMVRGVMAGLSLVNRSALKTKVFASTDEAFAWLAPQLDAHKGRVPTAAELRAVYAPFVAAPK